MSLGSEFVRVHLWSLLHHRDRTIARPLSPRSPLRVVASGKSVGEASESLSARPFSSLLWVNDEKSSVGDELELTFLEYAAHRSLEKLPAELLIPGPADSEFQPALSARSTEVNSAFEIDAAEVWTAIDAGRRTGLSAIRGRRGSPNLTPRASR